MSQTQGESKAWGTQERKGKGKQENLIQTEARKTPGARRISAAPPPPRCRPDSPPVHQHQQIEAPKPNPQVLPQPWGVVHPLPECQAWSQFAGTGDWVCQDRCHRGGGGGRTYTTSFTTGTGSAKHNEMVSLPVQWTDGQMDSLMSPARSVAAEEMHCDASCCTSLHAVDFHSFFLSIFSYSSWCLFIIIAILFTNLLNVLFNITSSCVVHLTYSSIDI